MVIYYSLILVVLTHCFARPTAATLPVAAYRQNLYYRIILEDDADVTLLRDIVRIHAHCLNLQTDQLNIRYENGDARSSYPP